MDFEVAASPKVVAQNIMAYQVALGKSEEMQRRARYHQSWYAVRDEAGDWVFGPSKFVGYAGIDADEYIATSVERNGRATEAHLRKWFTVVDEEDPLHSELTDALEDFLGEYGLTPRAQTRINILPAAGKRKSAPAGGHLDSSTTANDDLVALLIRVANSLPKGDRATIIAALQ